MRKKKIGNLTLELLSGPGGVRITALDKDGEEVGTLAADTRPYQAPIEKAKDLYVASARSYGKRGERIGTRMYEMMAAYACENGIRLSSDFMRSKFAEEFWRKQYQKGRVDHYCSRDYFKNNEEPFLCEPDERVYAESGRGLLKSKYRDQGITTRYRIKSCPAPTSLDGMKRRRRRR